MELFRQSRKFEKSLKNILKGKDKKFKENLKNSLDDFKENFHNKEYLSDVYYNHILGNSKLWEAHIFQRFIMTYRIEDEFIILENIGTHKNVLGMESYNILDNDPDFYI